MSQLPDDRPAGSPSPHSSHPSRPPKIPRYKVVLHGGQVKDMMFIVRTIMDLTRFGLAEATHKMWEAYHCGRSVLLITYRERAELYVEQFANRGLTVSIEPA